VQIVMTRVPTTRLPWRGIGVLALLAVLLAVVVAVVVGSRLRGSRSRSGPAANGLVALSQNGDLYTVDALTGEMKLLLGGPKRDEWLAFTPDGTRGVFLRWEPGQRCDDPARVGTIPLAGGAEPTFVQKDVLHGSEPMDIAPNGRELAFSAFDFGGPNVQHQRRVARRQLVPDVLRRAGRGVRWPRLPRPRRARARPTSRDRRTCTRTTSAPST
jgi:hypothetical protein